MAFRKIIMSLATALYLMGAATVSYGLTIDASLLDYDSWVLDTNYWTGLENDMPGIYEAISDDLSIDLGPLSYLNESPGPDDGDLWIPYADIMEANYLLVKDGGHAPAWYLFDLQNPSRDLTGGITLLNSWYEWDEELGEDIVRGQISNVRGFGGNPVPEPATMLLFLTGLAGLAGVSRRKKK